MGRGKVKVFAITLMVFTLVLIGVAIFLAMSLQNEESVAPTDSDASTKTIGCDGDSGAYGYGGGLTGKITIVNCTNQTLSGSCKVLQHKCDSSSGDDGKSGQCSSNPTSGGSKSYSVPAGHEDSVSINCDPGECGSCQADIECKIGGKTVRDGVFKSSGVDCVCEESEQCEGSNWVKRDCNNTVVSVEENDPRCVCEESATCEGTDWVVRDCNGNETSREVKDPRCYDPPVCETMTVDGAKSKGLKPGETANISVRVAKPTSNDGGIAFFNLENLNSPNNPKSAGIDPALEPLVVDTADNGDKRTVHPVTGTVSNQVLTANFTVSYKQLFEDKTDLNTGEPINKLQLNAYVGGAGSTSECVVYLEKLPPDPTPTPEDQLIIIKDANPTAADPSQVVDYTLTVTNLSEADDNVYKVTDDYNDALTYVDGSSNVEAPDGSAVAVTPTDDGDILTWDFTAAPIPIAPQESVIITYQMTAPAEKGEYPNTAYLYGQDNQVLDEDDALITVLISPTPTELPKTNITQMSIMAALTTGAVLATPLAVKRIQLRLSRAGSFEEKVFREAQRRGRRR